MRTRVHTKEVKKNYTVSIKSQIQTYTAHRMSRRQRWQNIMNKKSIPTVPTLERICDAFEFQSDLTDEQGELWDDLNADERRILMNFKDAEEVAGKQFDCI